MFQNFTRCVRPDGTAYGTSGRCRRGVERPQEEQEEQEYEREHFFRILKKRYSDQPELEAKFRDRFQKMEELANKLREMDDGKYSIISNHTGVTLKKRISDFDEVSLIFKQPPSEVSFQANGDYDYGQIEDPRERIRATLSVRDMFRTLTRALKPGEVLLCSAYEEDGRGHIRERAYQKIGFSPPRANGLMKGIVMEGGGVSAYEFSERGRELLYWHLALFGSLPER